MLSDDAKAAILNAWTESRPGGTETEAYPYVMEMIVAQVTLALTKPEKSNG